MAVRVLVTITAPDAAAAAAAFAERVEVCRKTEADEEGCLQYEVFASQQHPERFVLCELWSSKAIYDKHWRLVTERRKKSPPPPSALSMSVEMYEQRVYQVVDGTWMAVDPAERSETIRWFG
jgi:quinol monooxygenase YgiN